MKLKEIWSEIQIVRCSGDSMDVLLGGQQRISTQTIRRLLGRVMCELGDLVGLADGRSFIYDESRLPAYFHQDSRTEG